MTVPFAAAFAALALAAAPQNAPQNAPPLDTVSAFDAICLKQSSLKASFAVARQMGFVEPPASLGAALRDSAAASDAQVLWAVADGVMLMALASDQTSFKGSPMAGAFCAVARIPSDPTIAASLDALVGLGPANQMGEYRVVMFSEAGQRRLRVSPDDAAAASRLIGKQQLNMIMYGEAKAAAFGGAASLVMRLRPKPK